MYKTLSLALLALAAVAQAAPGAFDPRERGVANIEARKAKLTTIGCTTSVYTTTVTSVKPIVTKVKKTKTTKVNGKKTTITVTDTSTITTTATTTSVVTTTTPVVSTITTTTTAEPAPTTVTTTATPTTTADAPPTSGSGPSSQSRACEELPTTFTDSNGRGYTNTCNTDAYGGDLALIYTNSFEDCYAVCDANEGCVGFVFGGGSSDGPCYLKSTIQPAEANANEDLAILN